MKQLKKFVKHYFRSFAFFYSYLKNKVFIAFFLTLAVSVLDGLGLSMFFPLLQSVETYGRSRGEIGNLRYVSKAFEKIGVDMFDLGNVLLIIFMFFSLKAVARYLSSLYLVYLLQSFIRKIRLKLLALLNAMSFKKFIVSDVGRIQNTLTGEVGRVSQAFSYYFSSLQQGVMVGVYMLFAFFVDWRFAILVSIGGGLSNFLFKLLYKKTLIASRKLTASTSSFQGQVIQHVAHFKYLKATGSTNLYGNKLKETIIGIEKIRRRIGVLNSISLAAREPIVVGVVAIVIYIQVQYLNGSIGTIMITLLFFYRALTSLMAMQGAWNDFMSVSGSMENMQDFQYQLASSYERDGNRKFDRLNREIILEEVDFSYGNTKILSNISLRIHKNETIAFVGESGSGKTTLVSLIAGLLPTDSGVFTIDGVPMNELKKETYQQHIGYVSQDPVIFNDTLYNNITFWAAPSQENMKRFEECIRQASLYDFIQELPDKAETLLGNNGINLSGGQKQRVSIARELYKDVDILMLDEATSALDTETEKEIQDSIEALQGKYTILIVAHRLSTIKNADRIVLMDKGRIVDIDSFERLQEKQERFKKMVELQDL